MVLDRLKNPKGARKKRKRVGRGPGSGHGKTACRGSKGQKARSGGKIPSWFEGGQMPLQRRIPKRGFTNIFKKEYAVLNVGDLESFEEGTTITPAMLEEMGYIRKKRNGVKVLGDGELTKRVTIHAHSFSNRAVEKIKQAGGEAVKI